MPVTALCLISTGGLRAAQVLSGIVRRAVQDDAQMRVAMDEQIATYINDAG